MEGARKIRQLFEEAIKRYCLIDNGDNILVGLSGGKDSLALLEMLAYRARIHVPKFHVEAAFVRMTNIPYQNDEDYLHHFANRLSIPLHSAETSFDESTDKRHTHCFLCSWNRRKKLFQLAQQLGCNKIALGHNKDDIMQTTLMNLTFQGQFTTMRPIMQMNKFPVSIIRPLCLIRERLLEQYAEEQGYPKQVRNCPYEDDSQRYRMKDIIRQLEAMNPEFEYSLFRAAMKEEQSSSS